MRRRPLGQLVRSPNEFNRPNGRTGQQLDASDDKDDEDEDTGDRSEKAGDKDKGRLSGAGLRGRS